jgi:MFS family permease
VLWRNRDFLRLWVAQTVSSAGTQVSMVAIPLTAAVALGARPVEMGLLGAAGSLPGLLFGLLAGAWVDRLPRKPLLVLADLGRALLIGSIPVAALAGVLRIEQLYAVQLLAGLLGVLYMVAHGSLLPSVVAREQLVEANAKLSATSSATLVAGPGAAGLLVALLTAPIAVLVDALSFVLSGALTATLRVVETAPAAARRPLWSEIGEGLSVLWSSPVLRALALSPGIANFCFGLVYAVYVLYLTRDLGLNPAALGIVFAGTGVGSLVGSVLAARVVRRLSVGPSMAAGLPLLAVAHLCAPAAAFVDPVLTVPLLAFGQSVLGFALGVLSVSAQSLRQALTPDHLRGRVAGTTRVLIGGFSSIGFLAGGVLGESIGLGPTLLVGAVGTLLALATFGPVVRLKEAPTG